MSSHADTEGPFSGITHAAGDKFPSLPLLFLRKSERSQCEGRERLFLRGFERLEALLQFPLLRGLEILL